MEDQVECMCVDCGISSYLDRSGTSFEDLPESRVKVAQYCFCPECGGHLMLVGKAGDQPAYLVDKKPES